MINRCHRSIHDRHQLLLFSQLDDELLDRLLIRRQSRDEMGSRKRAPGLPARTVKAKKPLSQARIQKLVPGAEDGHVGRGRILARKAPETQRPLVEGTEETTGKDGITGEDEATGEDKTTAAKASETLKGAAVKADPAAEDTAGETPGTAQKGTAGQRSN
jgi:hypothetical protein